MEPDFVLVLTIGTILVAPSAVHCKLLKNHLDWKENHGETLLYAIKLKLNESHYNTTRNGILNSFASLGLLYTSSCIYIENCHIYTHTYHVANGSCAFSNTTCAPTVRATKDILHTSLNELDYIDWYVEIWQRSRYKRRVTFNDPFYPAQWHLNENATDYFNISSTIGVHLHLNTTGVWALGVTGRNVTVSVVDDGLEWNNPDIQPNYRPEGSIDLNDHDNDPMPNEFGISGDHNQHGTRCAGEIAAAANNSVCGVGVAYDAFITGVRALDGSMTDLLERDAFAAKHSINDIYSCSWGPEDDGRTVDGPHTLARASIKNGILRGRRGYGSIYVVASGNGGESSDNCNFDGYANSIYFVTIGAVDRYGKKPVYAEDCASMLAVTPSGDQSISIVTTDISHRPESTGCTYSHSGTSAAAPLAAGVIALVLSVNPCLTWRDVQHLIVLSSVQVDPEDSDWINNTAGLKHSHKHGFGLMSAWNIVNAAKVWRQMPIMSSFTKEQIDVSKQIIPGKSLILSYEVAIADLQHRDLSVLEYVEVTVTIKHQFRKNLRIELTCPASERYVSVLATPRPKDDSDRGFRSWTFSTVRCWGERAQGKYQLNITDIGSVVGGRLVEWSLTLHGSRLTYDQYQLRIRDVIESRSGHLLNNKTSPVCEPPPVDIKEVQSDLPDKVLKVLVVIGSFLTIAAVFTFIEDLCTKQNNTSSTAITSNPEASPTTSVDMEPAVHYNAQETAVDIELDKVSIIKTIRTDKQKHTNSKSEETVALLTPD